MSHFQHDLLVAIKRGMSVDTQKFIIQNINDINFGTSKKTNPLLMMLYYKNNNCYNDNYDNCIYNPESFKMLLEKGADPNTKNKKGKTALHYAAQSGIIIAMEELIKKGADPYLEDIDGNSIVDYAKETDDSEVISRVLDMYFKDVKLEDYVDVKLEEDNKTETETETVSVLEDDEAYEVITHREANVVENLSEAGVEEFDVELVELSSNEITPSDNHNIDKLVVTKDDMILAQSIVKEKQQQEQKNQNQEQTKEQNQEQEQEQNQNQEQEQNLEQELRRKNEELRRKKAEYEELFRKLKEKLVAE